MAPLAEASLTPRLKESDLVELILISRRRPTACCVQAVASTLSGRALGDRDDPGTPGDSADSDTVVARQMTCHSRRGPWRSGCGIRNRNLPRWLRSRLLGH